MASPPEQPRVIGIIFVALLIDLFAFTIILPLLPRLLAYYQSNESDENTLLGSMLNLLHRWEYVVHTLHGDKWDTVLLGGLIGSFFSFLQFITSPFIGHASDTYGRRPVLLLTMVGNIASAIVWLFSRSFSTFLVARLLAGLSEGNVQISIAMLSDITTTNTRSRALALVGLAFAIAFTVGPPLGAWFATLDITTYSMGWLPAERMYAYSMPALVSLVLLVIETIFLWVYLPETNERVHRRRSSRIASTSSDSSQPSWSSAQRNLQMFQGLYLFIFSGMEFTLVFLTFDIFDFGHMQQGKWLGCMGILSALVQGGYVRRNATRVGEKNMVLHGMTACCFGLAALSMTAWMASTTWLWVGIVCFAFASGTVVNCLTSLATLHCNEADKGRIMGRFRSAGQLGRALGPITATSLYWLVGPTSCYRLGALAQLVLVTFASRLLPSRPDKTKTT